MSVYTVQEKSSLQARADSLQKQCKDMEMAGQVSETYDMALLVLSKYKCTYRHKRSCC